MSHFTVLIIGPDIEKQLQPYHEYECTGIEDEYVVEVNKTEDVQEYLNEEIHYGLDSSGELNYHYRLESAEEAGYGNIKKGTRLEYFKAKGLSTEEIDEDIIEYHGYKKVGDEWFRFTNPNSQWDWWQVGGRWTGFFKLKEGKIGSLGKQSLVMPLKTEPKTADVAYKGDIDFDYLRNKAEERATKEVDLVHEATKDTPEPHTWEEVLKMFKDHAKAREFYGKQPRIVAFKDITKEHEDIFGWFSDYEDYNCSREVYIKRGRNSAFSTYAFVKDSQWFSKGKMGWWSMSSDETTQDEWDVRFNQLIDELPDDTVLTLVDAHI
jgi:hypothetical protein